MSKDYATYKLAAVYDTETCNYGSGADTRAYPILFIFNDIRNCTIADYEPDNKNEIVSYLRYETQALAYIDDLVAWGLQIKQVPVVCAYNLMFDLQPLMYKLNMKYDMTANAQSGTNVYTLDLISAEGNTLLRFWDTYHLEMNGLAAMGDICGIAKAKGEWDYSLIRIPDTPLTAQELFYARRDVQVIPAYLRYLLEANEFISESDFGFRVLTKTSIVRLMAKKKIGSLKVTKQNGKKISLLRAYELTCEQQKPKFYSAYALRKACFKGGFTFTAANHAMQVKENVASLDVTSMHHTFINGRYVPVYFKAIRAQVLQTMAEQIVSTPLEHVLKNYHKPFPFGLHVKVEFKNLKLKGLFAKHGIALAPEHKFNTSPSNGVEYGNNQRAVEAEHATRIAGWRDYAEKPLFAFGKLMRADYAILHLSEVELYTMSLVYEWASMRVILGEGTAKFIVPPDYVTLQSNVLYETKNDAKQINKHYIEGKPYTKDIPDTIPSGIGTKLRDGSLSAQFFASFYNSTVKGQFNGIYGTQAQDIYKPEYCVYDGDLLINKETVVTKENWNNRQPKQNRVFYNYGMRIVGGSRLHLVIAMILLDRAFGNKVQILGGDTDSLKVALDESITDSMIAEVLKPLLNASEKAISRTMKRLRNCFPDQASTLAGVGGFEIENCGNGTRYTKHMEAWNKARISYDGEHVHVTCAGLSRPIGTYHIESFMDDMIKTHSFEAVAPLVIGYNVTVDHNICHMLQRSHPGSADRFNDTVVDYMGNAKTIDCPESIALYPASRVLGDTSKRSNSENCAYLRSIGVNVDTREKELRYTHNVAELWINTETGWEVI